jgi:hypothetical protein
MLPETQKQCLEKLIYLFAGLQFLGTGVWYANLLWYVDKFSDQHPTTVPVVF